MIISIQKRRIHHHREDSASHHHISSSSSLIQCITPSRRFIFSFIQSIIPSQRVHILLWAVYHTIASCLHCLHQDITPQTILLPLSIFIFTSLITCITVILLVTLKWLDKLFTRVSWEAQTILFSFPADIYIPVVEGIKWSWVVKCKLH